MGWLFIKRSITIIAEIAVGLVVSAIFLVIVGFIWLMYTHPSPKYHRLDAGMTVLEAISIMESAPKRAYTPEDFCTTYRDTMLVSMCDEFVSTNTSALMVWNARIDTAIVVGLDQEASVSFLGFGDT